MKINATTLQNLDPRSSYYLSNTTGEIKQAGFTQWVKCFFGIGDGRAKAAALAARVKEALLADGAIESEATLDEEIGGLNKTRSLSGSALAAIASRFRASHAEAVGRADARRTAETIADDIVNSLVAKRNVHPDAASVGYMKRLAVYAAAPVIERVAEYSDREAFEQAVRTKMNIFSSFVGSAALFAWKCKLGYPAEQDMTTAEGKKIHLAGPYFKLDELHFRLILGSMANQSGTINMNDFFLTLRDFPESDLQAMKNRILAIPIEDAARPGAVVSFKNAFKAAYNDYAVDVGSKNGIPTGLPTRLDEAARELLDEMRGIYGGVAVPQDAKIFRFVPSASFVKAMQPLADAAKAEHRLLNKTETKDALRENCRFSAAAALVMSKITAFAAANNMGKPNIWVGRDLLTRDEDLCKELLACGNPDEAEAVLARCEDKFREQIELDRAAEAERGKIKDSAAAKLAEALGMSVDEINEKTDFDRLNLKASDIVREIVTGRYPGCREKGFNMASAFGAVIDKFVQTRVDLVREVNDAKGVSDAVKASWKAKILMTNKPEALHASKIAKISGGRGDVMRTRLEAILEVGITREERTRRLCEFAGSLNAEFVNLFGEEEWTDMGPDERDPLFDMLLRAVADKVPDFADKINSLREEVIGIPEAEFAKFSGVGPGEKIARILCFELAPEE